LFNPEVYQSSELAPGMYLTPLRLGLGSWVASGLTAVCNIPTKLWNTTKKNNLTFLNTKSYLLIV